MEEFIDMPKKTKKEKVIAAYRKKLKSLERQSSPTVAFTSPPIVNDDSTVAPPTKKVEMTQNISSTKEDQTISYYFIKDLKRSLFLIGVIFALEIFLYFVTIKHYLRFF